MKFLKFISIIIMSMFYIGVGIGHFIMPEKFLIIIQINFSGEITNHQIPKKYLASPKEQSILSNRIMKITPHFFYKYPTMQFIQTFKLEKKHLKNLKIKILEKYTII